jgi:chromosome segregation ATPase
MTNGETDIDKQIAEAERQLRYTQSEIKKVTQQLLPLREEYEVGKQKEIDERTKAGEDILDFEPSRELRAVQMAVRRYEQNLENLQQREVETKKQVDKLKDSKIEVQLLRQSKVMVELKKREAEILGQLKEVQQEIEAVEALKAELAVLIADRADG